MGAETCQSKLPSAASASIPLAAVIQQRIDPTCASSNKYKVRTPVHYYYECNGVVHKYMYPYMSARLLVVGNDSSRFGRKHTLLTFEVVQSQNN